MIVVVDHGLGNLLSVVKAVEAVAGGEEVVVAADAAVLDSADRIVLPGVGNFRSGIVNLRKAGLVEPLKKRVLEAEVPFLGICLGMQMLAEAGEEDGEHHGLGLIPGKVRRLDTDGYPLPHLGWDDIEAVGDDYLLSGVASTRDFYFVHSYVMECPDEYVVAWCEYGERFPAIVRRDNIMGIQFHPEKSREAGLSILRNFIKGEQCSKSAWFLSSS